jgi:phosphate transport system permease protein
MSTIAAHGQYRKLKNQFAMIVMAAMLALCLLPLVSLLYTLIANGWQVVSAHFLAASWKPVGEHGGIAHAIVGSICLLCLASLIAVPLGLFKGIYLSQRPHTILANVTRVLLDVMTGIPAIIVGVFIYTIVVRKTGLALGFGFSMISGALALAMIMLPIFARTTEEALKQIPSSVNEAGLALGLPRRRVVLRIIVRSAIPGILTGMFLALARVAGEAAPLLFTAFGSNEMPRPRPHALFEPVGSLPELLFDYARQPFEELVKQAWGAALVLVVMILAIRLTTFGYTHWRYGKGGAA